MFAGGREARVGWRIAFFSLPPSPAAASTTWPANHSVDCDAPRRGFLFSVTRFEELWAGLKYLKSTRHRIEWAGLFLSDEFSETCNGIRRDARGNLLFEFLTLFFQRNFFNEATAAAMPVFVAGKFHWDDQFSEERC